MPSLLELPKAPNKPEEFVQKQLEHARQRIRLLDWFSAGLKVLIGAFAALFVGLLVDHYVETPAGSGLAALLVFIAGVGAYLYLTLYRPDRREINPIYAARQVEQTIPDAKNSVVNYVDLKDDVKVPGSVKTAIGVRAARDLRHVDLNRVIRKQQVIWLASIAGLFFAAAVVAVFLPPTRTTLVLLNPKEGDTTILQGEDFRLDVELKGRVPAATDADFARVRLWYNPDDPTSYEERPLEPVENQRRAFGLTVPARQTRNGFHYCILAGNARSAEFEVKVHIVPQFIGWKAQYDYPEYLQPSSETKTDDPRLVGFYNTRVRLTALTNRPVKSGELEIEGQVETVKGTLVPDNPEAIVFQFRMLRNSHYRVHFVTTDGHSNPDPPRNDIILKDPVPAFLRYDLTYEYPKYLRADSVAVTVHEPNLEALRGTRVTLVAHANRPIEKARIDYFPDYPKAVEGVVDAKDPLKVRFNLPPMMVDGGYSIKFDPTTKETVGLPPVFKVNVLIDKPPEIRFIKPEQEQVERPANDVVAIEAEVTDDVGINKMKLCMKVDKPDTPLKDIPYRKGMSFRRESDGSYPQQLEYKDFVDLNQVKLTDAAGKRFELKAGMTVEYWLEAEDNFDLPAYPPYDKMGPNRGESRHQRILIMEPLTAEQRKEQQPQREKLEGDQRDHQQKQDQQNQAQQRPAPRPQPPRDPQNAEPRQDQKQNGKQQNGQQQGEQQQNGQQQNGQQQNGQQQNGQQQNGQQQNGQQQSGQQQNGQQQNGQQQSGQQQSGQQQNGQQPMQDPNGGTTGQAQPKGPDNAEIARQEQQIKDAEKEAGIRNDAGSQSDPNAPPPPMDGHKTRAKTGSSDQKHDKPMTEPKNKGQQTPAQQDAERRAQESNDLAEKLDSADPEVREQARKQLEQMQQQSRKNQSNPDEQEQKEKAIRDNLDGDDKQKFDQSTKRIQEEMQKMQQRQERVKKAADKAKSNDAKEREEGRKQIEQELQNKETRQDVDRQLQNLASDEKGEEQKKLDDAINASRENVKKQDAAQSPQPEKNDVDRLAKKSQNGTPEEQQRARDELKRKLQDPKQSEQTRQQLKDYRDGLSGQQRQDFDRQMRQMEDNLAKKDPANQQPLPKPEDIQKLANDLRSGDAKTKEQARDALRQTMDQAKKDPPKPGEQEANLDKYRDSLSPEKQHEFDQAKRDLQNEMRNLKQNDPAQAANKEPGSTSAAKDIQNFAKQLTSDNPQGRQAARQQLEQAMKKADGDPKSRGDAEKQLNQTRNEIKDDSKRKQFDEALGQIGKAVDEQRRDDAKQVGKDLNSKDEEKQQAAKRKLGDMLKDPAKRQAVKDELDKLARNDPAAKQGIQQALKDAQRNQADNSNSPKTDAKDVQKLMEQLASKDEKAARDAANKLDEMVKDPAGRQAVKNEINRVRQNPRQNKQVKEALDHIVKDQVDKLAGQLDKGTPAQRKEALDKLEDLLKNGLDPKAAREELENYKNEIKDQLAQLDFSQAIAELDKKLAEHEKKGNSHDIHDHTAKRPDESPTEKATPGSLPDLKNKYRAGELQLNGFKKNIENEEFLKKLKERKFDEREIAAYIKSKEQQLELLRDQIEAVEKGDTPQARTGKSALNQGAERVQGEQNETSGASAGSKFIAPPGFADPYRRFTNDAAGIQGSPPK